MPCRCQRAQQGAPRLTVARARQAAAGQEPGAQPSQGSGAAGLAAPGRLAAMPKPSAASLAAAAALAVQHAALDQLVSGDGVSASQGLC
jgi:hypothetical protein